MKRYLVVLALVLLLPVAGDGQSINYWPSGGGETTIVEAFPNAPTTGTSEELLYTVTIPANTWNQIGKRVFLDAVLTTAANGNAKIVRVRETNCSGSVVSAISQTSNNQNWYLRHELVSADTTSRMHQAYFSSYQSTGSIAAQNSTTCAFNMDCTFAFCGHTSAAAGDITLVYVRAYTKD